MNVAIPRMVALVSNLLDKYVASYMYTTCMPRERDNVNVQTCVWVLASHVHAPT